MPLREGRISTDGTFFSTESSSYLLCKSQRVEIHARRIQNQWALQISVRNIFKKVSHAICALDCILVVRVNRSNNSTAQQSIVKTLLRDVQINRTVRILATARCACVHVCAPRALSRIADLPVPVAEGVPVRFNSFTHRECSCCKLVRFEDNNAMVHLYTCQSCQPTVTRTILFSLKI